MLNRTPRDMHTTVFCTLAWLFVAGIANVKAVKRYEMYLGCESWHSSLAACADKGGKLAVITNRAVQNRISNLIRARGILHWAFWFNAHDMSSEGLWTTSDGVPLTFHNWNPGQPDNDAHGKPRCGGIEDCAVMWPRQLNYRWNDAICQKKFGYICEFDDSTANENDDNTQVTANVTALNMSRALSDQSVNYPNTTQPLLSTNLRYTTKTTDMINPKSVGRRFGLYLGCETWLGSHAACIDKGGRLAKISDNETQSRIEHLIKENGFDHETYWFDAHDQTEEGTWTTYDGERLNYHNWAPGQPDNYGYSNTRCTGIEDCAVVWPKRQSFKWNDALCTKKYAYICEFDVTEIEAEVTESFPVVTAKPTRTVYSRESIITTAKNNTNVDLTTRVKVVDTAKATDKLVPPKHAMLSQPDPDNSANGSADYMVTAELILSIFNFLLLFGLVIFLFLYLCRKTHKCGSVLREPFSQDLDKKEKGDEFNNTIF
ncbi:C-type mannose receptor 2-like [Ptychodera flava]|uniref:C-type mannose receptor 2-like n=1 Tax=Ptychodera flava TaxID=63121 RepID=UPI003969CC3C